MQRSDCVVVFGAIELFAELRRVDEWPEFVEGLNSVDPVGHHRYRWDVLYAGSSRVVDVVLAFDHRRRSITWKSLHRPRFDGVCACRLSTHTGRVSSCGCRSSPSGWCRA